MRTVRYRLRPCDALLMYPPWPPSIAPPSPVNAPSYTPYTQQYTHTVHTPYTQYTTQYTMVFIGIQVLRGERMGEGDGRRDGKSE